MPPPAAAIRCRASRSCGPQSHFSDPNTSPVRHSLCRRTIGGSPPNAPTTSAICSCPSASVRNTTIWVSGRPSRGSLARVRSSTAPSVARMSSGSSAAAASADDRTHKAGSSPAAVASRNAATAASGWPRGTGRSGPIKPRSRSRPGSANAIAAAASSQSSRCTSVGTPASAASRRFANASAAARLPLISSRAARAASSKSRISGVAVSTASTLKPGSPICTGRPDRRAAIARRTRAAASFKRRSHKSVGRDPTGAPTSGTAPAPRVPSVAAKLGRGPHVVEAASAIVLGPVGRAIAPPGEAAFGRRHEPAADINPVVRLLKPSRGHRPRSAYG